MATTYWPKISVVTTNYNLAGYLERTIQSVLGQGYPNLEYLIIDGGSTDGSVDIIKKYEDKLTYWVSEPDKGMYDALQKGLSRAKGDVMTYINSDDLIAPGALFKVAQIFTDYPEVNWITGAIAQIDEDDCIIHVATQERWSKLRYYTHDYQWIQQEGTFWRKSLWESAGGSLATELQLAGDFELWLRFFSHARLHTVLAPLGLFRLRRHRKTAALEKYHQEVLQTLNAFILPIEDAKQALQVRRIKWQMKHLPIRPERLKAQLNALFDYPPVLHFNPDGQKFVKEGE